MTSYYIPKTCISCSGRGLSPVFWTDKQNIKRISPTECPKCHGKGYVLVPQKGEVPKGTPTPGRV